MFIAMTTYYLIKDRCRQELIKYLELACAKIWLPGHAAMLDIGCGTGVPTLWLAGHFPGTITAIDSDNQAIGFLQQKIIDKNLQTQIKTHCTSFFDFDFDPEGYDLILAEGFLNIIGFENGFYRMLKLLKNNGYLVIHDEYKDHEQKCGLIKAGHGEIIATIRLDETIWWNDYYRLLEAEIDRIQDDSAFGLFQRDLEELRMYRRDPDLFRSVYYVIKKL